MNPTIRFVFATAFLAANVFAGLSFGDDVDFTRDIKPILSNRCFFCHGPDEAERKGGTDGLRLDTREGATEDLGDRAAIVPGNVDNSGLIERITSTDADAVMPPPDHGQKLNAHEVDLLKRWIAEGAKYAAHWSYVAPKRPALPTTKDRQWPRNEIDHFILSHLEKSNLSPSAEADRYTLIRRLSLDLTGLPPTIQEVDAFVADDSPSAYESLVDRLMRRKSYGEHWARLWLDLARYADSAGYADDPSRTIWLYRDYVIRSINDNKPFDQFTIEQLAGDLLPNATDEQRIATAFHRNTLTNNEGGTNDEEFRNAAIIDRVNTTLAVWMGTTMACAQCHTHKYDPITQEEYFKVFAIFNNTEDADRRDESPLLSIYTDQQTAQRDAWQKELTALRATFNESTRQTLQEQAEWEATFPRDLNWQVLTPESAKSQAGSAVTIDAAVINVAAGADVDTYEVALPVSGAIRAVRLETLPDPSLPASGPGHAGGNFVISRVSASLAAPKSTVAKGRFVRIQVPGADKMLSLAEVEVFQGEQNIAKQGDATQSSTGFDGPARLAIDGNTNGHYFEAKSTTHTAITQDPWWELDLKSLQSIDRIVLWNRTDGGTGQRLVNFEVSVLDDSRKVVWHEAIAEAPSPNRELTLTGPRHVRFAKALVDYSQSSFNAADVLAPEASKGEGWAIGGQQGQPHSLTLLTADAIDAPPASQLIVKIEQKSKHAKHTLGRFRLSVTSDDRVERWSTTPTAVIDALTVASSDRSNDQRRVVEEYYRTISPRLEPVRKEIARLEQSLATLQPATVPVMRELSTEQRRRTQIQIRGNFMNLGQEVQPGIPAAFPPLSSDRPADRLALAQWLINPENPLTARVLVNRYWEKLFGVGLVSTIEDFGSQGALPTNAELLDWLSTELIRLKWDTKALIKQLVMSAAYRQSARVTPTEYERDPDNQLLARGARVRLTAETIRDQALAAGGLLSQKMFGPSVNPPQPSIGLSAAFGGGIDWTTSAGEDKYRRGIYTTWRRSNPYPSMATFDAPNREVCTLRRSRSNTPLQALVTLNDPVFMEAAQGLARRIMQECTGDVAERTTYAFRLCLARNPKPAETERLVRLYETSWQELTKRPEDAKKLATDSLGPVPDGLDTTELAAWTSVANVLLNLDETLMPR